MKCLCLSALLIAQAPLTFDVASIKPNTSGAMGEQVRFFPPSGRVQMTNVSVRRLILQAYQLQESQLTGPKWIETERFDIAANAESVPNPTPPQRWEMIKSLLIDRFKLKVHAESRELSVFALVLSHNDGKPGAQLRQFEGDCSPPTAPRTTPPDPSGPQPCGTLRAGPGRMNFTGVTMDTIAQQISLRVGRPVVDRTGLTGRFTLDLEFAPAPPPGVNADPATVDRPADTAASIYTAIQEQLGLKLESQKRTIDVTIIDNIEHPTEG